MSNNALSNNAMSNNAYPQPCTPLPWPKVSISIRYGDVRYATHAANAFPYLVKALEEIMVSRSAIHAADIADHALAIARGDHPLLFQ
jgi:hypothetical protein